MRRPCYICRVPREAVELVELAQCPRCGAEAFVCLDCDGKPAGAHEVAAQLWVANHVCADESSAHLVMASARIKRGVNDLHEARHLLDACGLYELSTTLSTVITTADNARERVRAMAHGGVH